MLKQLLFLALGVAQLKGCATLWCDASETTRYAARPLRGALAGTQQLIDAALLPEADLLLIAGDEYLPARHERTIVRWSDRLGAQSVTAFRLNEPIGERLFVTDGGRWWCTVAGHYEERWGALFIEGKGTALSSTTFVELPIAGPCVWLPIEGSSPSGLYVAEGTDATQFIEAGPTGIRRRWTAAGSIPVHPGQWSVQMLADETLALVSLEKPEGHVPTRVMLRRLSKDADRPETIILAEHERFLHIASAMDRSGKLGIAVETPAQIRAAVLDPLHPSEPHWTPAGLPGDTASYPTVVSAAREFVVAWTRKDRASVQFLARSISGPSSGFTPTTVASAIQRGDMPPPLILRRDQDELLFVWKTDDLSMRRMPSDLSGYQLFADIRELVCRFGHKSIPNQ